MKLIVGLGNPGSEYKNTKHNMGFILLDYFADSLKLNFAKNKFNGLSVIAKLNGEDVCLLKPLSFMNLSGEVVKKVVDFYKIDISDILVISDDLDLKFLNIKLKESGSSGGHNGLKSIEHCLNTKEYKRLKIGIDNDKTILTKDYVLNHFTNDELTKIKEMSKLINNILMDFIDLDFEVVMSKYNSKNR